MNGNQQFVKGVRETAGALGMDPVDLATIISYETAGTFSPTQAGPTTQWGQHRGLIQFGEPQAREYGVDWNNAMESQLGADGAIVRYYQDNGWQPGMGLLDAYSIVNAGGPGLYNRSDANNNGAPGTVADKVNYQMGGHRKNAMRLVGGGNRTATGGAANDTLGGTMPIQNQPRGLLGSFGIQKMEEGAEGETGQRFYQRDSFKDTAAILAQGFGRMGIMGMEEIADDIAKQRTENKAKNKTAEYLRANGRGDLADMVNQGLIGGGEAAGILMQKPDEKGQVVSAEQLRQMFPSSDIADGLYNLKPDNTVTKVGGAPQVVVNSGDKGENKFAELDAKTLVDVAATGMQAQRSIGQINRLGSLLEGLPAGAAGAIKVAAGNFGIQTEGLDDLQAAQALINSLVPQQRAPGSGPMSDADLDLFKQSLPRIINSPNGNQIILDTMRGIAAYDAAGAEIVQRYRSDPEFTQADAFAALQARPDPFAGVNLGAATPQGGGPLKTKTGVTFKVIE